jgi:hypothetical protein
MTTTTSSATGGTSSAVRATGSSGSSSPRPRQALVWTALAVLAVQLTVRGWVAFRGYFYLDDFVFTGRAMQFRPFDPQYLFTAYNNHVMPGGFLWAWATTRLLPYSYPAVVTVCLLLQLAVGWGFFVVLRRVFGGNPLILVPFTAFVLSPITLPASLWWAAALNQLPQQLAMVGVLLCHLRYLRTGRVLAGLAGAAVLVAGLLFSEKTLLVVPLLLAMHLAYFAAGALLPRLRAVVVGHWRVWVAYAAVAVPYAAYYAVAVPSPAREPAAGASILQLAQESFARAIVPGILGGPWRWSQIGYAGALADPSPFAAGLALVVAAGVVGGTCLLHRRAWFGWAVALGYCLTDLALVALSRATFVGPLIADEYRYVTDTALVVSLALAFALMPVAGSWRAADPQPLERRRPGWSWLSTTEASELRRALPRPPVGGVVALAVVALAASALFSTVAYERFWRINPARPYLENARADLAAAPRGIVVVDAFVPAEVAWPLLGRYARTPQILSPLPNAPAGLTTRPAGGPLYVVAPDGHVRRALVPGMRARPGPVRGCGWLARPGRPAQILLPRTTLAWDWTVRVGYLSQSVGPARLTIGNHTTPVTLGAGAGELYVAATGAFDRVRLDVLSTPDGGPGSVCTDDVTVGVAVPAESGRP